jgi:cardiolipin synthase
VRIYEYQPSMMHAKTLVVDGLFSAIGSMNFDNRSLTFNNESQILALDTSLGQRMDSVFTDDLKYSAEIKLEIFRKRPWMDKVKEWGAQKIQRLL